MFNIKFYPVPLQILLLGYFIFYTIFALKNLKTKDEIVMLKVLITSIPILVPILHLLYETTLWQITYDDFGSNVKHLLSNSPGNFWERYIELSMVVTIYFLNYIYILKFLLIEVKSGIKLYIGILVTIFIYYLLWLILIFMVSDQYNQAKVTTFFVRPLVDFVYYQKALY